MHRLIIFTSLMAMATHSSAYCFSEAAQEYNIPEELLRAIAKVESGGRQSAVRLPGVAGNVDRSTDYGLMQINSSWLPTLSKFGINKQVLLEDACMNVKVGAWILADNVDRHGYGWEAVGAYNAGCKGLSKKRCAQLRNTYSNKVYSALKKSPTEVFSNQDSPTYKTSINKVSGFDMDNQSTGISTVRFAMGGNQ
jgi:soluble lytic murein transglycosylase-like protein